MGWTIPPAVAGEVVADQRVGPDTPLRVVDAILFGTHASLREPLPAAAALQDDDVLARAEAAMEASNYLTHEFGESVRIFSRADEL